MFQPEQERRLIPDARRVIEHISKSDDVLALAEFNSPFGVPDFTAVVGGMRDRTRRLRSGIPALLNEIDAGIASAASSVRPKSPKQIAYQLRWPLESVERRVPGLVQRSALVEVAPDRYLRPDGLRAWGEIHAIELKVSDWRRGLRQCRRYALWADSYFLVLAEVPESARLNLLEEVTSDGGGLMVAGEVILEPSNTQLKPSRRLWASEHVVAELQAQQISR